MAESDKVLIKKTRQGDEFAFEQLVNRHRQYVFNIAFRVLEDYGEAEDVTQEAFLRAWKGISGFRGEAKFSTWIYRITYNLCLNRLRSFRGELLRTAPLEEDLAGAAPSPADQSESHERLAFLHRQLEALPKKYALVLSLRFQHGMPYQEISSVLDLPIGTVKTHVHRARKMLASKLRQWEADAAKDGGRQEVQAESPCPITHEQEA